MLRTRTQKRNKPLFPFFFFYPHTTMEAISYKFRSLTDHGDSYQRLELNRLSSLTNLSTSDIVSGIIINARKTAENRKAWTSKLATFREQNPDLITRAEASLQVLVKSPPTIDHLFNHKPKPKITAKEMLEIMDNLMEF